MSFLKMMEPLGGPEDISMAERLRAVSTRGKLEMKVYENWQPTQQVAPIRRGLRARKAR